MTNVPTSTNTLHIRNSTAEFLIFTADTRGDSIEVRFEEQMVWLSQKMIAMLFAVDVKTISEHLQNIFKTKECIEQSVVWKFQTTASDGKHYQVNHYSLDAIIAVGYRVNSLRATQFRQWATSVIREFAIKGYVLDKQRLENGTFLNEEYYERLLEEIREIRLSERKFYQKVTDIYSTSIDYNKDDISTKTFFAKIQNKLHFAIHGKTAAELVKCRADANKAYMGLTTWGKSPDGKILKSDVDVAKNYLTQDELDSLGRIVSAFLDLAEERAKRKIPMTMEDRSIRIDKFLEFDERAVLGNKGSISHDEAKEFAESQREQYRVIQDTSYISDFDRDIQQFLYKIEIKKS